jgi:hypothetical protein
MKKTLLEQLKAELNGEPAPEGWYTIVQLMRLLGSKRTATENLVARKKWPSKKFRGTSRDGKELLIIHYHVGKL